MVPTAPPPDCANCGTPLRGRFCHACGQKVIEPEERRFTWFVGQVVKALTMADSRFLRSVGRLVFRPGTLDRDWIDGRRRRNLAPLNLFLLANLIYFFHPPLTDFNLSLADQVHLQPYSGLVTSMVEARLQAREIAFQEYAAAYQTEATSLARLTVILHAPPLALVLMALHHRRRLPYVDHLAVGLHFLAFLLLHAMVTPWLLRLALIPAGTPPPGLLPPVMLAVLAGYGWQQLRVAYGQPGWLAMLKVPALLAGLILVHFFYRLVQFLAAFAMT